MAKITLSVKIMDTDNVGIVWDGPTKIRVPEVSGEPLEQTAARVSLELAKASGYIVLDDDDNETAPGEVVRAARCHQPDS